MTSEMHLEKESNRPDLMNSPCNNEILSKLQELMAMDEPPEPDTFADADG